MSRYYSISRGNGRNSQKVLFEYGIKPNFGDTLYFRHKASGTMIEYQTSNLRPSGSYLIFSSPENFTVSSTVGQSWDGALEYCTPRGIWQEWDGTEINSGTLLNLNELYIRGIDNTYITGQQTSGWRITGTNVSIIGSIETLLDYGDVDEGYTPLMADYCFAYLFSNNSSIIQAPELPATTLTSNCYESMFLSCTSLTEIPSLPATTLASFCYKSMFQYCSSLVSIPRLSATTLASYCYYEMFSGCSSLLYPPELPATTLASYCYGGMFSECVSLTTPPQLAATTLADSCYVSMFYYCSNLQILPELPVTSLVQNCYRGMFRNCSKIKMSETETGEYTNTYRIPITGTGVAATDCMTNMFTGTGGTFTGTPQINTTYYTSNTVVPAQRAAER